MSSNTSENILDQMFKEGRLAMDDDNQDQKTLAKSMINAYVTNILAKQPQMTKNVSSLIEEHIAYIDKLVSAQLNEIMHHPDFQALESSWQGLHYLVMESETSESLKIKLLNASDEEVRDDLDQAVEFDQSHLFKQVYEKEYGTLGGNPYSVLIGNYAIGRKPYEMDFISKISSVAAASHAPFITAASPGLFDMDDFSSITKPRDLSKVFDGAEMTAWRDFRETEDSRYVSLVLPRVLARLPYGPDTVPVNEFHFVEDVSGRDTSQYLWMNAAFVHATRLTNAFAKYKWCSTIRGVEGGGLVEGLPIHTFTSDDGDILAKCPTEVAITDRRENELNLLGFITLCYEKNTARSVFFGASTLNLPKEYNKDSATANAFLSGQLSYMLAASRFAHYMKVIVRDKIGSFETAKQIENYLTAWIRDYLIDESTIDFDIKAKHPLSKASIEVTADPAKPGYYKAVIYLRPHFQLEAIDASIRLVANLPAS